MVRVSAKNGQNNLYRFGCLLTNITIATFALNDLDQLFKVKV